MARWLIASVVVGETTGFLVGHPSLQWRGHPTGAIQGAGKSELESELFGSITLVGAGPGDPDLLTVAAARILGDENTLVVADRLVSTEVLALVRGELKVAQKVN